MPIVSPGGQRASAATLPAAAAGPDAAEQRAVDIIESAGDAYVEIDRAGVILRWNRQAEVVFGWSRDEAVGCRLTDTIIPPAMVTAHQDGLRRYLATGEARILGERLELRARCRDGQEIPVELLIWRTRAGHDEVFSAFLRDVRERHAADAALRDSERRLREAEELAGLGSWEWDLVADRVRWSQGNYVLNEVDPALGEPSFDGWLDTVHPDDRAATVAAVQGALREGRDYETSYRVLLPDGRSRELLTRGTLVRDESGVPVRLVGTARDITEQQRVRRMQDEFVSVVSHELRTPLTAVKGSLALLQSGRLGDLDDRGRQMLDVAVTATDRLVLLVDDILDVERLQSAPPELQMEDMDLRDVVEQAIGAMGPVAGAHHVTLEARLAPVLVHVDRDRMLQVLTNLLSNAIKFSPVSGTVVVHGGTEGRRVAVRVSDQGRGIPADQLEPVFERFHQVDSSDRRDRGGTGLGLTICRMLVEQHGGEIWAESERGAGSTFTVALPAPGPVRPT